MENALKKYYEHFGENYPLIIVGNKTDDEIIARINQCVETNKREFEPEYNDDYVY